MSTPESARSLDRRTGASSSGAAPRMPVDTRHAAVASLPDATTDADPLFTVTRGNPSPEELAAMVEREVEAGSSKRDAIALVASSTGSPKRAVFEAYHRR